MNQAGRGGKWRSGRERGRRGEGGESRGELWKKPMRALTKAAVNLQVPLTRGTDGNSLTACRIPPPPPPHPVGGGEIKWLSGGKVAIICWRQHPALGSK